MTTKPKGSQTVKPKKSDHIDKGTRSTAVEVDSYVQKCKLLLIELKTTTEICNILCDSIDKSEASVKRYIKTAREELKESSKADVETVRGTHQGLLTKELREVLTLSDVASDDNIKIKYKKLALEIMDRLVKLYPNGLQPEIEQPDTVFNFSFKDASKDDIEPTEFVEEEVVYEQ